MKILIIGGGGREHALSWKLSQSPRVTKIYVAPGNGGTAQIAENVAIPATDIEALLKFAQSVKIDLTVVGADDPLAMGIVNTFHARGLKIWGPTKAAAQIESSKSYAKRLMIENGIPTARFETFKDYEKAVEYTTVTMTPTNSPSRGGEPIVIKASGLALGKGVTICHTLDEAKDALKRVMIDKIHGEAGAEVVVEKYLTGQEFSVHAFTDGKNFKLLPPSQDHKAIFDGDRGPNTGGIGTIAPLPWISEEQMDEISAKIVKPTLAALAKLDTPFTGLLYPGLMMTADGPKVIEFNARFGDPETQSYMRLLKTDLLDIIEASLEGRLADINIENEQKFACCVVLTSGGYPGKYEKGKEITGIEAAEKLPDIIVFHAGTKLITNGLPAKALATAGGRVLGVTATGDSLAQALKKAYEAIKLINFDGMYYRRDIGAKSLPT